MSALYPVWRCASDDFRCRNVLVGLTSPLSCLRLVPVGSRRLSWNGRLLRLCCCEAAAPALADTSWSLSSALSSPTYKSSLTCRSASLRINGETGCLKGSNGTLSGPFPWRSPALSFIESRRSLRGTSGMLLPLSLLSPSTSLAYVSLLVLRGEIGLAQSANRVDFGVRT